ncbi:CUB domain-containing protein 2-like [Macrobrachium rosenbergii]|uniref:CUB domain-containing protein 2-like n=1 Tax=Macrobrachium rosenbergii TaxID=79674 RepID=UPI0034D66E90
MIHQVLLMTMVARVTYAWPITPLDGYSRTEIEDVSLKCGDSLEFPERTFTKLNITFESDGPIPAGCSITMRINLQGEDTMNFGIGVSGYIDIQDPNNGEDCASTYLSVADEDVLDDVLGSLEKYCGNVSFDFHTTEDILVLELSVGQSGASGSGFQILVEPHYLCGGEITLDDYITTPDYPESYPRDINCFWLVRGSEDNEISINCHEFDLKPPRRGRCIDILRVVGGTVNTISCGKSLLNKPIAIHSNLAFIDFRSNERQNGYLGMNCSVKFIPKTKDLLLAKFFK